MRMRAVLYGTGDWAEAHIRAYGLGRELQLVGLCGHQNAAKLNALADKYAIPERALDLTALVRATRPEVVDIAGNPHYRLEGVRAALASGDVKLVNLEKPLALTPGDAYEIARLCSEREVLLTVNHQKKYLPAWRAAKEAIASGVIGRLEFLRCTCKGNLLEQGTHLVDMALHFNDYAPVSWVMGQIDELQGLDKPQASAPDAAIAALCFANGVRATLYCGSVGYEIPGETNKWYHFAVEAYGSAGHVKVSLNQSLSITTYSDGRTTTAESSWTKGFVQAIADHLDDAAHYAAHPARGHLSSLEHSLASFEVIMAIYASGCGDGRVALPRRFDDGLLGRVEGMRR